MKISQAFDLYYANYVAIRNQSKRIRETHDVAKRWLIQYLGDKEMEALTMDDIALWVREMKKTKCINTIRNYVTRLRVVCDYLALLGVPCIKTALIPIPKREATIPAFLTAQEVTNMIDRAYNLRNALVISLFYSSGIRISELISLNRGQIVDRKFTVIGKGNKPRLCFIDERTEQLMNEYLATRDDSSDALIVSGLYKQRMTPTNVQLLVKNTAKRAGLGGRHITPHTLRHSFATNFLRNNGNMRYLGTMLGHSSLQTTMMYTHVVDVDLQRQYEKYHTI